MTQKTLELEVQNRKLEQTTSDLRETSRLLEVLLENTPVYIYFKDEQSRFVHFSQSLQNAVRAADAAALKGKTDFDFFAPAYARETFADEQAILQSGEPIIGKAEKMQHADGRILWTLTTKMPWRNKDGRIIGTFGVSSDLTLIKATQAKLELAQTELLATARQAGMAEIATNVLHNVGNILNSVNVSADLLGSTLRTSRAQGLSRAVQLMHEHAADLGEFLTRDDKGRLLPGYLGQLALALAAEQQGMAEELARLIRSVDHIKDVVATQQSYAGSSSIVEPVQIRDLAEDALRMNDGSLTRHQVSVVRDFAQTPVLRLDRARVLQILVNLISNAKHAMDGVADRAHRHDAEHRCRRRRRRQQEPAGLRERRGRGHLGGQPHAHLRARLHHAQGRPRLRAAQLRAGRPTDGRHPHGPQRRPRPGRHLHASNFRLTPRKVHHEPAAEPAYFADRRHALDPRGLPQDPCAQAGRARA